MKYAIARPHFAVCIAGLSLLFNTLFARALVCVIIVISVLCVVPSAAQSVMGTYESDIPTNLFSYSPACNGPNALLAITLPSGGPWNVSGIDIEYEMEALGGGLKSEQRTYIYCQNTGAGEDAIFQGSGGAGIQNYSRTGVSIANDVYPGDAVVHFEMRAWRTAAGSGCNLTYNKVNALTWTITVYYTDASGGATSAVGIGTNTPAESAVLELRSTNQGLLLPRLTTAQRNAIVSPQPGTMIFNTTTQDVEVFKSTGWSPLSNSGRAITTLLGGSSSDAMRAIQQTNDGGYIVAGRSNSSNTGTLTGLTNNGNSDYWILKLDNSGGIQWQKLLGGDSDDYANHIQQTSDGGYIVAGYSNSSNTGTLTGLTNNGNFDYWIIKLDNGGAIQWQKLLGGDLNDYPFHIIQTSDGGYIVAGYSNSSNTGTLTGLTNNGNNDYWILKLDYSGAIQWQKLLGGDLNDFASHIQQTSDGAYIVAGYSTSSNTGTLTGHTNNGLRDYWILKLDSVGTVQWQKLLGGDSDDYAFKIQQTSDGGYIVAGYSNSSNTGTLTGLTNNGNNDFWIIKLDNGGVIQWQKLLGGTGFDVPYHIQQTSDGGYIVAGNSNSSNTGTLTGHTNNGSFDYWIVKLDNGGAIQWQKLLGGDSVDTANHIQQTSDGGYIVAGSSLSSNTGTLTGLMNNGNDDCWILKLDKNGNPY